MVDTVSWQRIVIKVGSSLIAPEGTGCSTRYGLAIAQFIADCQKRRQQVVLVTSGSVAAGKAHFKKFKHKTQLTIPEKQALAAVGQAEVLAFWQRFFDFPCAQILLTHDDFNNRKRYLNASNTIKQLLAMGALPVVNENDSVAVEELKVGDNDNLAAQVAVLTEADGFIICSDVDGLYDQHPERNPQAKLIGQVDVIDAGIYAMASGRAGQLGVGGMKTKIQAAEKATTRGIETYIVNGTKSDSFLALMQGAAVGTRFSAQASPIEAKKHWLQHLVRATGSIVIDAGAVKALQYDGASLLSIGITEVKGRFKSGDIIAIEAADGKLLAKGVTQYDSGELEQIKGQRSEAIDKTLGFTSNGITVHRDDLVLID